MNGLEAVDISSEMGEGFALPPGGVPLDVLSGVVLPGSKDRFHPRHRAERFDDQLVPLISSVHLACGLHSGDPVVLQRLVPRLIEHGIQLGAHPSYPDIFRFGQNRIELTHDALVAVLLYQFGALDAVLRQCGEKIRHVKCHGALAFDVAEEAWACEAMVEAIEIFDPSMILVAMAGTPSVERARRGGLTVIEEGFIDRQYGPDGRLVPRNHPQALHKDPEDAVRQLIGFAKEGRIRTVDGGSAALRPQTFCLHSDTPAVGDFANMIAAALRRKGIAIRPLAQLARTS